MRNLKRALSLALASVMLVGLMVVGTGASYSDVTSKQNTEAIEVLQAVGIMTGDDKGNFNPDQKVTRNEMAVVMANLLDLSVSDFGGSKCPFTDVPAWAAKYVTACYADGIVAGTSATTFGGSASVNAVQAGLMVMKALGYFQYQEDFGDDWQLEAVKQASKIDLYDDIAAGRTDALTRNEVAQLVLNALQADVVDFTGTVGTDIKTTDGTTIKVGFKSEYTALTTSYNYNSAASGSHDEETRQLAEDLYDDDLEKTVTTSGDDFGRPATEWTYKGDEVGTYADEADYTYTAKVTKKALYNDLGKDVYDDLTASKDPTTLNVSVDGAPVSGPAVADYLDKNSTAKIGGYTGNGVLTEVYVNDDNDVTICIINTYLVQASDDYNSSKETLAITFPENTDYDVTSFDDSTLSLDDFAISNYKEDDYILVTGVVNSTKLDVKTIAPAEVVTGKVTTYSTSNDVEIGGTTYKYANVIADTVDNGKAVEYTIGEDATVVMDAYGYVIYVDEALTSSDNYLYVYQMDTKGDFSTDKDLIADAIFADGTRATITIKNDEDFASTYEDDLGWYTYTKNSAGKYTLSDETNYTAATAASEGAILIDGGQVSIGTAGTVGRGNSSTVYVVLDNDDDITVYTGVANAPTVKTNSTTAINAVYTKDGSYAEYVFIDADKASVKGSTSSDEYIYVVDYDRAGTDSKENDYIRMDAIVNGDVKQIYLSGDDFTVTKAEGLVHNLYTDIVYDSESGYISDVGSAVKDDDSDGDYDFTVATLSNATVDYSNDVLTINNHPLANVLDNLVADDYKVFLLEAKNTGSNPVNDNDDDYDLQTLTASGLRTELKGYAVNGTMVAKMDDDKIVALYVYVSTSGAVKNDDATVKSATAVQTTGTGLTATATVGAGTITVAVTEGTPADTNVITVTATANGTNATVSGPVTLTYDGTKWNVSDKITVTAEDGTTADYTVSVG